MVESKDNNELIPDGNCFIRPKKGRPTKLTMELIESISSHIRKGNYVDVSCAYENISRILTSDGLKKGLFQQTRTT
ncbi:MAG TPA: hypothetical protein VF324_08200 [Methanobacterium sp.]